jgi:hypothetical protein
MTHDFDPEDWFGRLKTAGGSVRVDKYHFGEAVDFPPLNATRFGMRSRGRRTPTKRMQSMPMCGRKLNHLSAGRQFRQIHSTVPITRTPTASAGLSRPPQF